MIDTLPHGPIVWIFRIIWTRPVLRGDCPVDDAIVFAFQLR